MDGRNLLLTYWYTVSFLGDGWYACYNISTFDNSFYVYHRVVYWIVSRDGVQASISNKNGEVGLNPDNRDRSDFMGYFYYPSSKAAVFLLDEIRHEVNDDI